MSRAGWSICGMIGLFLTATIFDGAQIGREAMAQLLTADRARFVGTVTYDGPLPDPIPIPEAGTVRHLIEVDAKSKGLKDAVIWLEGVSTSKVVGKEAPEESVVMDQQNYAFVPHVLAVEAGREVEFRNSDGANHGVMASSPEPKNRIDVVTPPGGHQSHRFVASRSPVAIGCPIHGMMAAWVYVFDHPYHAVSDEHGEFRLPPVAPGRYTLQVRHPDGGMQRKERIIVRAGEPLHLRIDFHGADRKTEDRPNKGSSS